MSQSVLNKAVDEMQNWMQYAQSAGYHAGVYVLLLVLLNHCCTAEVCCSCTGVKCALLV